MRADRFFLMRQQFLRVTQMLGIPIVLLALSSTALAQIEPALPGSIEYSLINNNQSWIETSDPITTGSYVVDLLTDRLDQPVGRGLVGVVTGTGFDSDYGVMAATVYFGRDNSVGIVFPELSPIKIVATGIAKPADRTDSTGSGRVPPRGSFERDKVTLPDPLATGDWSASVDGLRARLSVRFAGTKESGRDILIYLELQNHSAAVAPISLFYSDDDNCSTTWSLTDHKGTPIAKTPIAIRRPLVPPYWIVVPFDSTLRLRASNGSSVTRTEKGSTLLLLPPNEFWPFPKGSQEEYFLSCSFEAKSPPKNERAPVVAGLKGVGENGHSNVWQGKLTIPKVKIPLQVVAQ